MTDQKKVIAAYSKAVDELKERVRTEKEREDIKKQIASHKAEMERLMDVLEENPDPRWHFSPMLEELIKLIKKDAGYDQ